MANEASSLRVRRRVDAASRSAVRWLNRAAPRLVRFGSRILKEELARSRLADPAAVRIAVGDVRFMLSLTGAHQEGPDYERFSKTGDAYEPIMLACLTRLLQRSPPPRFMDVGAYLGYYTCYVSALLGDQQDVYAVESNPLYADAIRESVRINGFSRVGVFQAALSDRVEPVGIDGLTIRHGADAKDAVLTVTLDDLCDRNRLRPTVIKMDVHGAEGKILLGMPNTLANVDVVLLELHRLAWLQQYSPGVTRAETLDALENAGLKLHYVAGHSRGAPKYARPDFQELTAGRGYSYRRLDRQARDLLLFDRLDEFVIALRHDSIEALLGPSASFTNY